MPPRLPVRAISNVLTATTASTSTAATFVVPIPAKSAPAQARTFASAAALSESGEGIVGYRRRTRAGHQRCQQKVSLNSGYGMYILTTFAPPSLALLSRIEGCVCFPKKSVRCPRREEGRVCVRYQKDILSGTLALIGNEDPVRLVDPIAHLTARQEISSRYQQGQGCQ